MPDHHDWACPDTAAEALALWDKGEPVRTVEMGGFGPGYEQAIHVLVFEILREAAGTFDVHACRQFEPLVDAVAARCSPTCGGFTGAQVGVAQSLAFHVLRDGWRATVESAEPGRRILVSRTWPHVELEHAVAATPPQRDRDMPLAVLLGDLPSGARARREGQQLWQALSTLLDHLPDSEHVENECWGWAWDSLPDAARAEVKDARKAGLEAQALLEEPS